MFFFSGGLNKTEFNTQLKAILAERANLNKDLNNLRKSKMKATTREFVPKAQRTVQKLEKKATTPDIKGIVKFKIEKGKVPPYYFYPVTKRSYNKYSCSYIVTQNAGNLGYQVGGGGINKAFAYQYGETLTKEINNKLIKPADYENVLFSVYEMTSYKGREKELADFMMYSVGPDMSDETDVFSAKNQKLIYKSYSDAVDKIINKNKKFEGAGNSSKITCFRITLLSASIFKPKITNDDDENIFRSQLAKLIIHAILNRALKSDNKYLGTILIQHNDLNTIKGGLKFWSKDIKISDSFKLGAPWDKPYKFKDLFYGEKKLIPAQPDEPTTPTLIDVPAEGRWTNILKDLKDKSGFGKTFGRLSTIIGKMKIVGRGSLPGLSKKLFNTILDKGQMHPAVYEQLIVIVSKLHDLLQEAEKKGKLESDQVRKLTKKVINMLYKVEDTEQIKEARILKEIFAVLETLRKRIEGMRFE